MSKTALGIDIGGTKIYCARVNEKGELLDEPKKYKTPHCLDTIKEILTNIIKENNADVVAIATAGAVNNDNTRIIGSTGNMVKGYRDLDFQSLSHNVPLFIENDANAAAWAEHITGAAKGTKHSITLTFGTGVGGGIIIDGRLLKGKSGTAGEVHFKMSTDKKRQCTCGAYDCFEIYTSGKGLVLTLKELYGIDATTYQIIENVQKGNDMFIKAHIKWQEYIADGIIGLNNIFDTEVVVLSGSMAQFLDTDFIEKRVNAETITTPTKIKHASAGNFAGLIGAALLALNKYC